MYSSKRKLLFAAMTMALSLTGTAHAEGLNGTVGIGASFQNSDAEPFGSNVAADADFPGAFDSGDGIVGVLGVGHDLAGPFRIEGRLSFHQADFNSRRYGTGARNGAEYILDGDIESTSLTIDGFYDIPTNGAFSPYVKGGIGVSSNRYSARLGGAGVAEFDAFDGTSDGYYDAYADRDSTEFAWNIGLGGSFALNDRITLFGEYQYASFGDGSTGQDYFTDGFRVDSTAHEVLLGLRSQF
ncbi:outer membrane protein [Granulosicoccus sp. 3-233]|uniref:outer membrane protein n=1 Tax=Granulosicoccus sp. 3-233 TaxID=3417969 RepID=UPI003D344F14